MLPALYLETYAEVSMKKGYIYKITNLINGKIYIGKSTRCDPYHLKTYFGSGIVIDLARKKYGKENFKKEILEMISFEDEDELDALEIAYIKKYDAMNEAIGYNRSTGGEGGAGVIATPERKKKISDALRGKPKSTDSVEKMKRTEFSKNYTIIFEDGTVIDEYIFIDDLCKKYNVNKDELIFNSERNKFTNDIMLLNVKQKEKGWYNNGYKEVYAVECPEGFVRGRLDRTTEKYKEFKQTEIVNNRIKGKSHWYNNGIQEVCTDVCPPGFTKGMLHNCCVNKNKHHYTNGVTNIISSECPPGFWKGISGNFHKTKGSLGMKWFNNGKEQKLGYEKPEGEEWVYGKLKKEK